MNKELENLLKNCIQDAIRESEVECADDFRTDFRLSQCFNFERFKKRYEAIRERMEDECYHGKNGNGHTLDYRKAAAILCCALVQEKPFSFDVNGAMEKASDEEGQIEETHGSKRKLFNRELVNTVFINYKTAYLAALHLLYYFVLYEAYESKKEDKNGLLIWKKINQQKQLAKYYTATDTDSFDVNIITGLARSDMRGKQLDPYFLSLQFYQIEMYTFFYYEHIDITNN